MASLAQREDLAAKFRLIYSIRPWIKYSSNFQPRVGLSHFYFNFFFRQAEVVKAYRDAHLGVHL